MSTPHRQISILLGAIVLATTVAGSARAQPGSGTPKASTTSNSSPWARGVSDEDQEKALAFFGRGNEHLSKLRFSDAVAEYRKALEHWDHPAIHYNLTIALIRLDKRLEAYEAIEKALEHGSAPLEPEQYQEALNYQALLRNQVAHIEIASKQPGTRVQLDGQPYITGPGSVKKVILPGHHQIVATKKGHEDVSRRLLLLPGESRNVQLRLFTSEELTEVRRRWPAWKPWALAGGGVALASMGGLWHWRAKANIDEFDNNAFSAACGQEGCADDDERSPSHLLTRARWYQGVGITSYAIGGAALTTGLVLVFLNREREERLDRSDEAIRISIVPGLSPASTGLSLAGSF
jgi:tetratricopeptide (TPR) repeat protein